MYGYMRTELYKNDRAKIQLAERRIREHAEYEGFDLGCVFHESENDCSAFADLVTELQRAAAHHVLIPSPAHLDGQTRRRGSLINQLHNEARAATWALSDL